MTPIPFYVWGWVVFGVIGGLVIGGLAFAFLYRLLPPKGEADGV